MRQEQDIADLLFLAQSWSGWLLDHHGLKEGVLLPSFEAILSVAPGTLAPLSSSRSRGGDGNHSRSSSSASSSVNGEGRSSGGEVDDEVSFLLHRVHAYASATHKDPRSYDAITFEALLIALAEVLVPHLTMQIGLLVSMREMCYRHGSHVGGVDGGKNIPARLPIPMVTITRTPSRALLSGSSSPSVSPSPSMSPSPAPSPPISPTYSTFSAASSSTSYSSSSSSGARNNSHNHSHSHNNKDKNSSVSSVSFSLFPSISTTTSASPNNNNINNARPSQSHPHPHPHPTTTIKTSASTSNLKSPPQPNLKSKSEPVIERSLETLDINSHNRLAKARVLLEADARANKLMKTYLAADSRASASMDRFIVLPMIVRLRDATFVSPVLHSSASAPRLHNSASSSSLASSAGNVSGGRGMMMMMEAGGGGNMTAWPRMSILAVHAVADKLSPRHEGAWRFLPCDVWGRPRELPFLG